jgi:hypothetical protein
MLDGMHSSTYLPAREKTAGYCVVPDAAREPGLPKKRFCNEAIAMWDTCAIDLRVQLPSSVALQVREVQEQEPELLSRMLMYAMARRTIFDRLMATPQSEVSKSEVS